MQQVRTDSKMVEVTFWNSGRTNYANEVLKILHQHDHGLSPAHKKKLIWGRCINVMVSMAKICLWNCVIKDCTCGIRSNQNDKVVARVSHALGTYLF